MIKKLLNVIILVIMIFSSCSYATNVTVENKDISDKQTTVKQDENKDESKKTESKDNNANKSNSKTDKSTSSSQSTTSNNKKTVKSSEARLEKLTVDVGNLSPEFNKDTDEYRLTVDLSTSTINISTQTLDSKATATILGNKNIKKGENTITIKVKAEDGTIKKYYIYVTKMDNVELANADLESIEIEDYTLTPAFSSSIYNYNLDIDKKITSLNIIATPQNEKAKVEIDGNEKLQEGKNTVKITVTAEDNTTTKDYKINVNIDSKKVKVQEEDKMPAIMLIGGLSVCIIALGIYIVAKKR